MRSFNIYNIILVALPTKKGCLAGATIRKKITLPGSDKQNSQRIRRGSEIL
jgi:hypothetical protein